MQPMINTLLDPVVNFGKVTVSTGYNNVLTVIVLTAGHGSKLPNPSTDGNFNIVWFDASTYADPSDDPNVEIVRCTARAGDTLTIVRAQEGTLASNKNTPTKVYGMILSTTKKTITDIKAEYQSGVSTHAAITSNVHGFDVSGNAPAQAHGSSRHTGIIGDHTTNLSNVGTNTHAQVDTHIANVTTAHLPSQAGRSGSYLKTNGSIASWQSGVGALLLPEQIPKVASTNIRNSHNTETGTSSTSLVLLKTMTFTNGLIGTIRIYIDTNGQYATGWSDVSFTVNSIEIARIEYLGGAYTTRSADVAITLLPGESIQVWGLCHNGTMYIKNFGIAYDNDPNVLVTSVNS